MIWITQKRKLRNVLTEILRQISCFQSIETLRFMISDYIIFSNLTVLHIKPWHLDLSRTLSKQLIFSSKSDPWTASDARYLSFSCFIWSGQQFPRYLEVEMSQSKIEQLAHVQEHKQAANIALNRFSSVDEEILINPWHEDKMPCLSKWLCLTS